MRRYSVTEAPRATLLDTITAHIERDEHLNPDKPHRIEAYRRARAALEYGAIEVQARGNRFRVIEAARPTYGVNEGSRAEIVAELEQYRADRQQQGKGEKADAIGLTLQALEAGAIAIRAEGTLYRVVED